MLRLSDWSPVAIGTKKVLDVGIGDNFWILPLHLHTGKTLKAELLPKALYSISTHQAVKSVVSQTLRFE
jgi:hypothetical protein